MAVLTEDLREAEIAIIGMSELQILKRLKVGPAVIYHMVFSHDGRTLAGVAPKEKDICVFNLETGKKKIVGSGTVSLPSTLAFCSDNTRLIAMSPWSGCRPMWW